MTKLALKVLIQRGHKWVSAQFRGQEARALLALVNAGEAGVTAQEVSSWALRLSAYVLCLRRAGLDIEMERESHPGGWHGRYRLHTKVKLVDLKEPPAIAA